MSLFRDTLHSTKSQYVRNNIVLPLLVKMSSRDGFGPRAVVCRTLFLWCWKNKDRFHHYPKADAGELLDMTVTLAPLECVVETRTVTRCHFSNRTRVRVDPITSPGGGLWRRARLHLSAPPFNVELYGVENAVLT